MGMGSCHNEVETPGRPQKPRKDIVLTRAEQEIVNGHGKFAFDLFHEMNRQEKQDAQEAQNMIMSPLSLSLDLSMFANAVDDDYYGKILNVMNLDPSTTREQLNGLSRMLVEELINIDSQVEMNVSNSIWYRPGLSVKQSFADEVMKQYSAPCTPVAFWEKESEDIINGWVTDATGGMIRKIHEVTPTSKYTLFKFLNAMYFSGEWVYQFNKDKTVDMPFTNLDGTKVKVPMMYGETSIANLHDDSRSMIGLPFGNSAYRMFFILPDYEEDFESNIAALDYETWSGYRDKFFFSEVYMSIPRLDLNCKTNMTGALAGMGIEFDEREGVRLGNMFEDADGEEVFMNEIDVTQVCAFKMEEVGVKAAAVTSIEGMLTAAGPVTDKFVIDRPFMILIEEQSTGAILFMGKVTEF